LMPLRLWQTLIIAVNQPPLYLVIYSSHLN